MLPPLLHPQRVTRAQASASITLVSGAAAPQHACLSRRVRYMRSSSLTLKVKSKWP